jgi:hypothetical protein
MARKRITEAEATHPGGRDITTEWAYGYKRPHSEQWNYVSCDSRDAVMEELSDLERNFAICGENVQIYSRQRVVEVSEWYKR